MPPLPSERLATTRAEARACDVADPLAAKRDAFILPADTIYLDGNSLGPLTHVARAALRDTTETEWGQQLVGAWNTAGWIDLPVRVGALIAPLIGAAADDVICADSTSVNLFKVLAAALALRPERQRIVSERGNFPTDVYIAERCAAFFGAGHRLDLVAEPSALAAAIDNDLAVLLLTHVDYRSGYRHDMAELTRRAHAAGALVIWDLAHSAGAMPIDLAGCDVDFAIGCGYKYLNGGPGAPAFVYVNPRHQASAQQPLAGWFGHAAPFAFEHRYREAPGIKRFLAGTPPVLAMRALEAALGLWDDVDLADVRAKSVALCECFMARLAPRGAALGLTLASPADPTARGSQVSYQHPDAYRVMQALIARRVIGDMRAPDILRFGFAPLYTRYVDALDAADALCHVLETQAFERFHKPAEDTVT